jgi:peroxiredoxin
MSTLDAQIRDAEQEFLTLWTRGPADSNWSSLPPQVGDRAPDMALSDSSGQERSLSDLWREQPALLLFWRHYGCGCGLDRAKRLREEYDEYVRAGASVVLIGQGEPERAAAYAREQDLPCLVLCDPDYRAYAPYGLKEGQAPQILFDAPQEFWSHPRELGERLQQQRRESGRPLVDNPWLLPGEFVIDRDGVVRLAYRYQYCEDFPNPLVLTTAIQMAANSRDLPPEPGQA